MEVSRAVVSKVRVLAITHILVGALLVIFGIANGVTQNFYDAFNSSFGFFGIGTGVWMCIAGGLGIPGSTPQRTPRRTCFAGTFMGFAITSAVFGGIIIILYSITLAGTSCQDFCLNNYSCGGGGYPTLVPRWDITYSYDTKLGLAVAILTLGIIEFGTGIWVSICLCVMKPCCKNLEEREPLVNSVTG
ncbi:PREDICTED: uncharacterized protein LOC107336927 isoform X1 [Acropora digitifera]|uniref:uncharacterized protein LOC107336927 isoform X1 n=1 Tax=Acropora digitifera TaxID=70779 RepID=UPI00077A4C67|nr:PREDICTED: uncharacterized protein LOC107336927 isoform X1 [Acropora digitifera]